MPHWTLAVIAALVVGGCAAPQPTVPESPPKAPPTAVSTAPAPKPPASKPPPKAKPAPSPSTAAAPRAPAPALTAAPHLDLKSLEERLKETSAIGVLTKLSLKNQVDDLVGRFRAFHLGQRPPALAELRPSFELLLMKVLSLLQDKDPGLAKDINASRESIWAVLADREKLERFT